jgi:threonine synthase
MISYESTRGEAPVLGFADVLLAGLATDGGLYCPEVIPDLPELDASMSYAEIAEAVMWPFVEGSVDADTFRLMVADAYRPFRDPAVTPLIELGDNQYLLDLSRGPTLAFKDIALQLVGRMLEHELGNRGERAMVFAATSGDTGSAAIEALANRDHLAITVLHPLGRVSDVQRKQMTTVDAPNVMNAAITGTFDDCQDLVKAAFNDPDLRAGLRLAAVNSINWGRVMAQIVYYAVASLRINEMREPISFTVPTGNFGNVLSGWYAKRMGVPIDRLVVASNRNDVLTRYFETGTLSAREVTPSLSPSMDIQISSNFERLLWEASGRDGAAVTALLAQFRANGSAAVPGPWRTAIAAEFDAARVSDDETLAEIARLYEESEILVDPHTAVGTKVARDHARAGVPMVTLGTADPAKFPDAVERATGVRPELPGFLSELFERQEHVIELANDLSAVSAAMTAFQATSGGNGGTR